MRSTVLTILLLTSVNAQGQEIFKPTGRYVVETVQPAVPLTPPVRYINWPGWGQIDLETYNRNCNCGMCNSIRLQQQTYRTELAAYNASLLQQTPVSASQAATPDVVVTQIVDQLQLKPSEVVADLGCGDGRILIAAVKKYKCKGVGVEIDASIAEVARRKVKAAGLDNSIKIITGDALQFNPDTHNVTAITAYLYPELLRKLLPKFKRDKIMVVATPYHEVPGLNMVKHGDVYVWKKPKRRPQQFLVSEPWCRACPAAKAKFIALGWPEENIITIDECERRFGFRVPHIPYLIDDPTFKL